MRQWSRPIYLNILIRKHNRILNYLSINYFLLISPLEEIRKKLKFFSRKFLEISRIFFYNIIKKMGIGDSEVFDIP